MRRAASAEARATPDGTSVTARAAGPAGAPDDAPPIRLVAIARLLGIALAGYMRLVAATCRLSGSVTRDQVVLAFWHEYNLTALSAALKVRADLPHVSFSTRGFRGVVISTLLERSKARVRVLALPDEADRAGGRRFALSMAALGREGCSLVVTPDGPFGPYRVAKPGATIVARAAGLPIQPWAAAASPAIRLTARWDRQLVPLPFSRIRIVPGERQMVEERRLGRSVDRLQAELDRVSAVAERQPRPRRARGPRSRPR
ncbi:MAG: hypothetical protein DLM71_09325 [Chloroflexi bacterium]|nr:MAG: hypothetical protein DLM71_09325 [Chloroflexota bacterium]